MKKDKIDYIISVHGPGLMSTDTLEEAVEQAVRGGCTVVQLREKDCTSLEFYETARGSGDNGQVSGSPHHQRPGGHCPGRGADGVHVGQDDLPAKEVRRILGPDKVVGVSAGCVERP